MTLTFKQSALVQFCLALAYLIVAVIALNFATIEGNATILWPSSGIALAALVKFGARHTVIGIFLGAYAAGIYVGNTAMTNSLIALGNTLEPLAAGYLLRYLPFSPNLYRINDYLSLVFAGSIAAIISAFIGSWSLVLASFIPLSSYLATVLYWWQGDVLGIILIAPFLLLFRLRLFIATLKESGLEALALCTLSTFIALTIFTDFYLESTGAFRGTYALIIPLAWSIIRYGHIFTAVITFLYFIAALGGLFIHQGIFVNDALEPNLALFWSFFIVVVVISYIMSYFINDRNALYQAINNSQTETYIFCDITKPFEFVNRAALANLGVSLTEALKLTPLTIRPRYSQQQFSELMSPLIKREVSVVSFETVHQRHDGSVYPVEINIQSIENSHQHCFLASVVDISERLEIQRHRILGNHVCDLSPQAIMITDKDRKIIRVNSVFTTTTGYDADEVIGKNPHLLKSGRHDKKFYKELWHELNTNSFWQGEVYNRRKNGELYLQHLTIKVIYNPVGDVENYISMFTDITQEREQSLHLKHLSEHDILTGLPNRERLQQDFKFALTSAKRNKKQLGILFIDLNDFKPINDRYGHTVGDQVLQLIASRMSSCVRELDTVARVGGDEFIILVTDVDSNDACQILSTKLKSLIAEPIIIDGLTLQLTASIGVALYPNQGEDFMRLSQSADAEMYKDKLEMKRES